MSKMEMKNLTVGEAIDNPHHVSNCVLGHGSKGNKSCSITDWSKCLLHTIGGDYRDCTKNQGGISDFQVFEIGPGGDNI